MLTWVPLAVWSREVGDGAGSEDEGAGWTGSPLYLLPGPPAHRDRTSGGEEEVCLLWKCGPPTLLMSKCHFQMKLNGNGLRSLVSYLVSYF